MAQKLTLADYEECVRNTAKLVVKFGEAAIPLFERAEFELEKATKRQEAVSRAKAITVGSEAQQ
jgi:hypothetical protein